MRIARRRLRFRRCGSGSPASGWARSILESSVRRLRAGARLVVISFHSSRRIVKTRCAQWSSVDKSAVTSKILTKRRIASETSCNEIRVRGAKPACRASA